MTAWDDTNFKAGRKAKVDAYIEHEETWSLEARVIPLNHRFAFYSGWDAALKHLGVQIVAGQERTGSGADRG